MIAANLPGAALQWCRTNDAANLMSTCPKSSWPAVKAMLHSVYDQPDPVSVHTQFDELLDPVTGPLPAFAEHLDDARGPARVYRIPKEIWRQIWSNNPNERLNKEIRRRTDVAGNFPDRDSVTHVVGAVLVEQRRMGRRTPLLRPRRRHRARMNLITTTVTEETAQPTPSPPESNRSRRSATPRSGT